MRHPGFVAGLEALAAERTRKAAEMTKEMAPIVAELRGKGLSSESIAEILKSQGKKTGNGKDWTGKSVRRVFAAISTGEQDEYKGITRGRVARPHQLKTWPDPFAAVSDGSKTAEFRKDDRGFGVGDILYLNEWSPESGYTGRVAIRIITDIRSGGNFGIPEGYAMLSIAKAPVKGT